MRLSPRVIALAVLAAAIILAVVVYLQSRKPDCDCYFPNEGDYGIYREGGGCAIVECEPPRDKKR